MPSESIKPNLFIVGAMKAGSTALHSYLNEHPDVFMCDPKEPCFFSKETRSAAEMAQYLALFSKAGAARYIGESSTQYAKAPIIRGVPERLRAFSPDARIIYIIRDPLKRIVSQYLFNVRIHGESRSLLHACKEDPGYLQIGDYYGQISPYLSLFGQENVYVLTAESLKQAKQSTLDDLFVWLGLPPHHIQHEVRKNSTADGIRLHSQLTNLLLRAELEWVRRLIKGLGLKAMLHALYDWINPPKAVAISQIDLDTLQAELSTTFAHQKNLMEPLMNGRTLDWPYKA